MAIRWVLWRKVASEAGFTNHLLNCKWIYVTILVAAETLPAAAAISESVLVMRIGFFTKKPTQGVELVYRGLPDGFDGSHPGERLC